MVHAKLPTDENLIRRGCTLVSRCDHSGVVSETTNHLLFSCPFAAEIWCWLENILKCNMDTSSPLSLLMVAKRTSSTQLTDIFLAVVLETEVGIVP